MNEANTASAPQTNSSSATPPAKSAVKVAPKSSQSSASPSQKPVKGSRKAATPSTPRKTAKTTTATLPAAPVKAKASPRPTTQTRSTEKKKAAAPAKLTKDKKVKVVRDSFTLPKSELLQITDMKKRAMALGVEVKKSELIRAGLQALVSMSDTAFKKSVAQVPTIKTGRPAKN
jgi:hypothetical protein